MLNKKWVKYLCYFFCILSFTVIASLLLDKTNYYQSITYNPYPRLLIDTISHIIFGVLLGLDCFLKEKKEKGTWKINKVKLLYLGVPSLIFSLYYVVQYTQIAHVFIQFNKLWNLLFFYKNNYVISFSQILFGFVILTMFYKHKESE